MREATTAKIRRGCRLFPHDVVQYPEPDLLHRHADAQVNVKRAADPNRSARFENPMAGGKPCTVELVIEIYAPASVPLTLVDLDHAAGDASDSVVGEQIRGSVQMQSTLPLPDRVCMKAKESPTRK